MFPSNIVKACIQQVSLHFSKFERKTFKHSFLIFYIIQNMVFHLSLADITLRDFFLKYVKSISERFIRLTLKCQAPF